MTLPSAGSPAAPSGGARGTTGADGATAGGPAPAGLQASSRGGLTAAAGSNGLAALSSGVQMTLGAVARAVAGAVRDLSREPQVILAAAVSLLGGLLVAVLAILSLNGAVEIGLLLPGVVAVAGGVALVWSGWAGPRPARFRWLIGLSVLAWALGQLVNAGLAVTNVLTFPSAGDLIAVFGAPLALLAVLAAPWPGRIPHSGWRLGLDASLLGVSLSLPLWHFWFARMVTASDAPAGAAGITSTGSAGGGPAVVCALIVVAEVTLVCVGGLAFLRDFDRYVLTATIGIAIYAVGDLCNFTVILQDPGRWSPVAPVLWSLGWPLIIVGLLHYQPMTSGIERGAVRLDLAARGLMMSTTAALALLVITLTAMITESAVDRISLGLVIVTALVFWARELLNARFRTQLLHELHAEATADPLTGLANRRVLADRMEALSQGDSWCLLTVDLDGFKDVNDLLGHGTGDKLLAAVAGRLLEAAPDDALVSRIGGDEFAILLPGNIEVGARVGAAIVTAVRQSAADVEGVARVEVSASVGVAAVHGEAHGSTHSDDDRVITLPPAQALPANAPFDGGARVDAGPRVDTGSLSDAGQRSHTGSQVDAGSRLDPGMRPSRPAAPVSYLGAEPISKDAAELSYGLGTPAHGLSFGAGPAGGPVATGGSISAGVPVGGLEGAARLATPEVVDPLSALSASSAALRVAKAAGRNRVEIYDAAVAQIRRRRLRVEERLRSAVETGAITVQYQPIVDLRRGVMAGCEALARWVDPELGRVDPGEFITVAEQTGLVVAIGERVLQETLRNAVADGLFERGLRVSCNVSPVQLRVAGFDRVVQEAIAAHGVPREQLVIEVTEQVLVEEGQAAQTLHRLAGLGLTIAIDDFGTGYSALGYLQRLPADILKIDRSLTSSLIAEPRSRAITRAVVDLGRTVGLSVVVEGVESSQVDDLVRKMGVGFGQGLYYGAAMPAAELAKLADRLKEEQAHVEAHGF